MCPPAQLQILQQEFHTQKQVRTIQSLRVFILYLCRCVNRVMPLTADCYFRHWLSTGRYSWYFLRVWEVGLHRGCAFCGARFRIIIQNSPGVVPEPESVWPTVSMIQLPFASSLHLCEDDLPAVDYSVFPPKDEHTHKNQSRLEY